MIILKEIPDIWFHLEINIAIRLTHQKNSSDSLISTSIHSVLKFPHLVFFFLYTLFESVSVHSYWLIISLFISLLLSIFFSLFICWRNWMVCCLRFPIVWVLLILFTYYFLAYFSPSVSYIYWWLDIYMVQCRYSSIFCQEYIR